MFFPCTGTHHHPAHPRHSNRMQMLPAAPWEQGRPPGPLAARLLRPGVSSGPLSPYVSQRQAPWHRDRPPGLVSCSPPSPSRSPPSPSCSPPSPCWLSPGSGASVNGLRVCSVFLCVFIPRSHVCSVFSCVCVCVCVCSLCVCVCVCVCVLCSRVCVCVCDAEVHVCLPSAALSSVLCLSCSAHVEEPQRRG